MSIGVNLMECRGETGCGHRWTEEHDDAHVWADSKCPRCGDEGLTVSVEGPDGEWDENNFRKVVYAEKGVMLVWDERNLVK